MNRAAFLALFVAIGAGLLLASIFLISNGKDGSSGTSTPATSTNGGIPTSTPATSSPAFTSTVRIALLDISGTTTSKERGCDRVVLVPVTVATTSAPLTAALQALFRLSTTTVSGFFNYIDRTNETLSFDRVTILNGTANIYLTGSLSGLAGVCDDPRAAIQIEETALQFATVNKVQIYLNGTATTLTPSQQ